MPQLEAIAQEIFAQVRTTIVLNMRFMDMAVFRLKLVPERMTLATDGENLYYQPLWILKRFKGEANAVTRDYLHVLLHCVFRHPFVSTLVNQELWDLACDIAVEGLICELNQPHFSTKTETSRKAVIDCLRKTVQPLTAEKLYHYFQNHALEPRWAAMFHADDHAIWHSPAQAREMAESARKQSQQSTEKSRNLFGNSGDQGQHNDRQEEKGINRQQVQDDDKEQKQDTDEQQEQDGDGQRGQDSNGQQAQDSDRQQGQDGNGQQAQDSDRQQREAGDDDQPSNDDRTRQNGKSVNDNGSQQGKGSGIQVFDPQSEHGSGNESSDLQARYGLIEESLYAPQLTAAARQAIEDEWRDISEHVQMDLETFAKERGLQAGSMSQLLAELNREKYDYVAFLKKFAVMGEVMMINDDEFDYIFYTYGLKLFSNMPLIEPLEYKEVKRVRGFVIAIDTSGSTSGELVNCFLTKTYNILMSTESFFSRVEIYIIQCDADIQDCVRIQKREDFEEYIENLTIKGGGGTDFRPVFNYVDELINKKQIVDLKGMIYFTDGMGQYPARKPQYQTAFVFLQHNINDYQRVPPWAIKLILEEDEFEPITRKIQ